ncbi:MAG: AMP-binding protein [Peptococcaceae bacterium]|nr:AMP-binding protein [Peptococcaceae bacterium]
MIWIFDKFKQKIAAISDTGESITYDQLNKFGERIGCILKERSLVFCVCTNTVGSLSGYTAFLNNRMVPLLLDMKLDRTLLARLIHIYKPDYLWVPQDLSFEFTGTVNEFSGYGYCLLKTSFDQAYPLYEQLGLLLSTSGSTGSPKLVRQSYENIKANISSIIAYLELDSAERPITTLPMNFTYGLSVIHTHLEAGATILLTTKTLMQKEFWTFLRSQGATSLAGVPYTYEILKRLRFFDMELPGLKTLTQAGGKLSTELHERFAQYAQKTGRRFYVMYGQTEATARMSYLPYQRVLDKIGSIGIPIPGGSFSILDDCGKEISVPDSVGELVYQGKNVTLGYAERGEDLAKGDENGGILFTGDLARRDKDGYYYIAGRKKRIIKLFGNRINLDETEHLLKEIVEDCACTGEDNHLLIYVTGNDHNRLLRFISEKTGINPSGFEIRKVDYIPRNEAGKILYSGLESQMGVK